MTESTPNESHQLHDESEADVQFEQVGELPPFGNPPEVGVANSQLRLYDDEAIRARPSTPALIDGILPERSLGVIYGEPGIGKSFLVLDLSCSIATGIRWHWHKVKRGPVVYIAAEGTGGLPGRITAWAVAHGARGRIGVHFLPQAVRLVERGEADALIRLLRELPAPPVLVVIDTLARSMAGADENSSKDMSTLIDVAAQIQRALCAAVLFVHHPTKKGKREIRGSGHLGGAADMIAVVTRSGSTLTVECEKPKDYESFAPMSFELVRVAGSLVPLAIDSRSVVHVKAGLVLPKQQHEALTLLATNASGSLTSSEWAAEGKVAGIPKSTFFNVAKKLLVRGLVEKHQDGSHVWYTMTKAGETVIFGGSNGPTT